MKHPNIPTGKSIHEDTVVFERGVNPAIVLELRAIQSYDEFDKLFPPPKPPRAVRRGETEPFDDVTDAVYLAKLEERSKALSNYTFIKTIVGPAGIEWEKVKMNDPATWHLFSDELLELGLNAFEINALMKKIVAVSLIDEDSMQAARDAFLASKQLLAAQNSRQGEPKST
jgi:hypothetical protein